MKNIYLFATLALFSVAALHGVGEKKKVEPKKVVVEDEDFSDLGGKEETELIGLTEGSLPPAYRTPKTAVTKPAEDDFDFGGKEETVKMGLTDASIPHHHFRVATALRATGLAPETKTTKVKSLGDDPFEFEKEG